MRWCSSSTGCVSRARRLRTSTLPSCGFPYGWSSISARVIALYVGTWRAQRDEFNEVPSVQVLDHYAAALVEMRKRFGSDAVLRKALPTWRDARSMKG